MRRPFAALLLTLLLPLPVLAGQVTVKPGETLSEIADRHGVSLSTLMKLNGISKADHVEVGQVLKLPGGSSSGSRGAGSRGSATGTVRVQEGDTLSEIADRQGMSLSQLMALNGISTADHVEVGQVLKVRGTVAAAAAAPAYRRGASVHVVKPGESLSEIADGYGVSMSRLVAINQIQDPDHVEVGSRLKLQGPVPSSRPANTAAATPRPAPRPKPQPEAEPAVSRATQQASPATAEPVSDRIASRATTATAIASGVATTGTPAVVSSVATAPIQTAPRAISTAMASETARATTTATAYTPTASSRTATAPISATSLATARSSAPATSPVAAASTAAAGTPGDWRRYGPLQVDWSGWQPMGGSLVAPVMNAKGDTLYLAINCGARKLNATSSAGDWRTWDNPQADFEMKLVNDLCRSRSS